MTPVQTDAPENDMPQPGLTLLTLWESHYPGPGLRPTSLNTKGGKKWVVSRISQVKISENERKPKFSMLRLHSKQKKPTQFRLTHHIHTTNAE